MEKGTPFLLTLGDNLLLKENSPVPWKIGLRQKTRFLITIVSAAGFHGARDHVSLSFLSDTHGHKKNPFSLSQTKVMCDAGDLMGSWCPAVEAMRTLEYNTDPETGRCGCPHNDLKNEHF